MLRRRLGTITPALAGTLVLALLGALGVASVTRFGAGLSPDSVVYITTARNLVHGLGFVELEAHGVPQPLVHFPPLYPALLAVAGFGRVDPLDVARWLNILLFAGSIGLAGLIIYESTRGSLWAVAAGTFLVVTAVDLVRIHAMAWSEPVFIFLSLLGLWLLVRYARSPARGWWLASAAVIGLAPLARYAAPPLILTGLSAVFAFSRGSVGRRVRRAAQWLLISCAPLALWLAHNLIVAAQPTDRSLVYHPVNARQLTQAVTAVTAFLPPLRQLAVTSPKLIVVLLAACMLAALALAYLAHMVQVAPHAAAEPVSTDVAPILLAIYAFTYVSFLLVSISFFDYSTPLDARLLSPALVCLLILAVILGHRFAGGRLAGKAVRTLLLIAGIVCAAAYLNRAVAWVIAYSADGQGYAARMFAESPTLLAVRQTFPGRPIYSNSADAIYIISDRPAEFPPMKSVPGLGMDNPAYTSELDEMRQRMNDGALLVYLRPNWRDYLPSEEELKASLSLTLVAQYDDGAVYVRATATNGSQATP